VCVCHESFGCGFVSVGVWIGALGCVCVCVSVDLWWSSCPCAGLFGLHVSVWVCVVLCLEFLLHGRCGSEYWPVGILVSGIQQHGNKGRKSFREIVTCMVSRVIERGNPINVFVQCDAFSYMSFWYT